ncbi:MAG TPA: hypothetical protein VJG90_07130 [Candidatus Nanoarchaeia archaeon]|nr:hypothetical protein [Candidatus Nanoarchaeia archaeon]
MRKKQEEWFGNMNRASLRRIFYLAAAVVGIIAGGAGIIGQFSRDPINWILGGLFVLIFFLGVFFFGLAFGEPNGNAY